MSSMKELQAELEALKAQNQQLKDKVNAKANAPLTLKVSQKGAVSAYGMGRFPVTLYKTQWNKLLSEADRIKAFLKENDAKLATKD